MGAIVRNCLKPLSSETSKFTQIHVKLVEKLHKVAKRPVRLPISHLRSFFLAGGRI